jgi:hypothetical protein
VGPYQTRSSRLPTVRSFTPHPHSSDRTPAHRSVRSPALFVPSPAHCSIRSFEHVRPITGALIATRMITPTTQVPTNTRTPRSRLCGIRSLGIYVLKVIATVAFQSVDSVLTNRVARLPPMLVKTAPSDSVTTLTMLAVSELRD